MALNWLFPYPILPTLTAPTASHCQAPERSFFRVHPKGVGVICKAQEGIEPETFVTEYYGELYPPWRWFEKQDAIKKCNPGMALPEFYNITIERPRDDDAGYGG